MSVLIMQVPEALLRWCDAYWKKRIW